jgi:hypothetical protein
LYFGGEKMTERFYIKQSLPDKPLTWALTETFYWNSELNNILKKSLDGKLLQSAYDSVNWERYYERLKGTPLYDWVVTYEGVLTFGGPYHIENDCFFSSIGDASIQEGDYLQKHPELNQVLHDIHLEAVNEMIDYILDHAL